MATTIEKDSTPKGKPTDMPAIGEPSAAPTQKASRKPLILGVVGVLLVLAVIYLMRFMAWSAIHVSTDDATISTDVVQISPQVSGTVTKVNVSENQHVKKGDLLVELDGATFQTAYEQAKANLDLAIAQSQSATANVDLTKGNTRAQVVQAKSIVGQSSGGIDNSLAMVAKSQASVSQARAQDSGAKAGIYGAQANISIAKANRQKALDAVQGSQAQLDTALAAVKTAQANVEAAQANANNAEKQAERNETLFRQGAVSGQVAEQMRAAADVAKAQVNAVQQQFAQAQAVVVQRRADLRAAKNQIPAADAAISQANAQLRAAQETEMAARDTIRQTQAEVTAAKAAVDQAMQRREQATGQLQQANTAPSQVAISQSAQSQADARVELAKAALREAKINLDRTKIYAPADGRVSKNTVEVGNLVQPGASLMAILPDEDVWVVANFKETQLADVRPNQPVEIEVDAYSGVTFKGHVGSISAGTGSTFALLPADNATGNFTKVVQRVPVKIILDHAQPKMEQLRAGMSVVATITTSKDKP